MNLNPLKSRIASVALGSAVLVAGGALLGPGAAAWAAETIRGDDIRDNTVDSSEIQNETITGADIDNGTLTGADLKNETVTGADVDNGTIKAADLDLGGVAQALEDIPGLMTGSRTVADAELAPPAGERWVTSRVTAGSGLSLGNSVVTFTAKFANPNAEAPAESVRVQVLGEGDYVVAECTANLAEGGFEENCSAAGTSTVGMLYRVVAESADGSSFELLSVKLQAVGTN